MVKMLEIKNLNVSVEDKLILKNLNLSLGKGQVHAIMGPNGSGKSTIAHTLAGKPNYDVNSGEVSFNGEDLLSKDPYERSLDGLFLAFQYPIELPGVTNASYLKQIVNAHRKSKKETPIDAGEFLKILKEKSKRLDIPMDPSLIIMDETDSGLDVDALKSTAEAINKLRNSDRTFLIITHYLRLLEYIEPDFVHVFQNGSVIETGDKSLASKIDQEGYN